MLACRLHNVSESSIFHKVIFYNVNDFVIK